MDYEAAVAEEQRIAGLLEKPPDYEYRTAVLFDEEVQEYFVGVAWYKAVYDDDGALREFGNVVGISTPGTDVDALRRMIDRNYTATMANL